MQLQFALFYMNGFGEGHYQPVPFTEKYLRNEQYCIKSQDKHHRLKNRRSYR